MIIYKNEFTNALMSENDYKYLSDTQKLQMKLYTEEQIRKRLNSPMDDEVTIDEFIESLNPIELPSDEEIENHVEDDFLNSNGVHKYSEEVQLLMKAMCKAGMKCMRDKIQGGNK
jgi:uncharacterized protein with von Willebrand factor type A (vWA) domain